MLRNTCIALVVTVWLALVVVLSLSRLWFVLVPVLALGGMVEAFAHHAVGSRLDALEPACRQLAVELEPDEDGWHGVVTDAADSVIHVSDSYPSLEAAALAAWEWTLRNNQ
jgi:hypothetical protein